jgi:YfiH family protein
VSPAASDYTSAGADPGARAGAHHHGSATRIELRHATVLFSGRDEGDLGRTTGPPTPAVQANRAAILELCGLGAIAAGSQVHACTVVVARADRPGYVVDDSLQADGQVTQAPELGVGVHVADCLPIAVAGDGGVAMIHAGWRGLAGGIVPEAVRTLRALGVQGPLEAAIGPGAGGCCYEAGPEVHAPFAAYRASNGRRLDLAAIATAQLQEAGVDSVGDTGLCTLCAPAGLFFSHRRDGPETGRQGGFAWLR